MKCRLCGTEKNTRREMHGHLMVMHREDYQRADYILERLVSGAPDRVHESKLYEAGRKSKLHKMPEGFRLLKDHDEAEAKAIKLGFLYIDSAGNLYEPEEAKTEGWI